MAAIGRQAVAQSSKVRQEGGILINPPAETAVGRLPQPH
jgi:hypothetical protein